MPGPALAASYVVPLRWGEGAPVAEMTGYLRWLRDQVEVIVVDGSDGACFEAHQRHWGRLVAHVAPEPRYSCLNGKVGGVLTGVALACHDAVVLADDDVRYDRSGLDHVVGLLAGADLVRPQNFFFPLPWHARWDTARSLLNRATGGDFPGTLGVRRSALLRVGGYDGDVLFENLELMRTIEAAGGVVRDEPACLVRRLPPTTSHFWGQRVRQAYDEWARPGRMAFNLALLPGLAVVAGLVRSRPAARAAVVVVVLGGPVVLAEVGRRRDGGRAVFPASSAWLAPVWLAERAACAWLAVAARLRGGCRYAGRRLPRAATPSRVLRRRLGSAVPARPVPPPRAGQDAGARNDALKASNSSCMASQSAALAWK